MKEFKFILTVFLLLFMGLSTLFPEAPAVGAIGTAFGHFNRKFFGFLGFIYPFLAIAPAYMSYRGSGVDRKPLMYSGMFLFVALLLLQANITDGILGGIMGQKFLYFLRNYIGDFGIWLFIFSILSLASIHLVNAIFGQENKISIFDIFEKIRKKISDFLFKDDGGLITIFKPVKKDDLNDYVEVKVEGSEEKKDQTKDEPQEDKNDNEKKSEEKKEEKSSDDSSLDLLMQSIKAEQIKMGKVSAVDDKIDTIKKESLELLKKPKVEQKAKPKSKPVQKKLPLEQKKKSTVVKEIKENTKILADQIKIGKSKKPKDFKLPKLSFLNSPPRKKKNMVDEAEIDQKVEELLEKLRHFKIEGDVVRTYSGPIVTTFEFKPAANIKVSKILTLQDDLAMALKAKTIRIQAPIPGKDVVGIEIPNNETQTIYLKEILESQLFENSSSPLTLAIGKDIVGNPFLTDLQKLPHLLIAGTTGSGKSVGVNAMLLSLLYKNSPDDLKLLMIDPKMLEFSIYNDIPHLLTPVITQPKQAIMALANMVVEMEKRYKLMSKTKTKNIDNYNEKAEKEGFEKFPFIVIIIDELADLMMTSGKDVEFYIARLAQMARASGIHIIVATQRPSVDVVTGLIKANLPSRISFKVGQKVDSKIILDSLGAESLLGKGDMLFTPPGSSSLVRLHAPFVTEQEIEKIVEYLKSQREVVYDPSYLSEASPDGAGSSSGSGATMDDDFDELYDSAKEIVLSDKKTSISYIQRRLQIGYNRAARIIEQLEMTGVLSAPNTKGQREIL